MSHSRKELISIIQKALENNGFTVSTFCDLRPSCFDIVARKSYEILLLKILYNVDAFKFEDAEELSYLAKILSATPIIVGYRNRRSILEKNMIYERYGVPVVSVETFIAFLVDNVFPRIFVQRGGRFVKINTEALKSARKAKNISVRELSEMLDITPRALFAYEGGEISVSFDIAVKLEKILGISLIEPLSFTEKFSPPSEPSWSPEETIERIIDVYIRKIGLEPVWTRRSPFNFITKEKYRLISGIAKMNTHRIKKRISLISDFSSIFNEPAVIFINEKAETDNIDGVVLLEINLLKDIESFHELDELINERL